MLITVVLSMTDGSVPQLLYSYEYNSWSPSEFSIDYASKYGDKDALKERESWTGNGFTVSLTRNPLFVQVDTETNPQEVRNNPPPSLLHRLLHGWNPQFRCYHLALKTIVSISRRVKNKNPHLYVTWSSVEASWGSWFWGGDLMVTCVGYRCLHVYVLNVCVTIQRNVSLRCVHSMCRIFLSQVWVL